MNNLNINIETEDDKCWAAIKNVADTLNKNCNNSTNTKKTSIKTELLDNQKKREYLIKVYKTTIKILPIDNYNQKLEILLFEHDISKQKTIGFLIPIEIRNWAIEAKELGHYDPIDTHHKELDNITESDWFDNVINTICRETVVGLMGSDDIDTHFEYRTCDWWLTVKLTETIVLNIK